MLSINSNLENQAYVNPIFIGRKSWYHISILFSFNEKTASFYCDNKLFSKNKLPDFLIPSDLRFYFGNPKDNNEFQIDLLRFIKFNNSIEVAFANSNYTNFRADSSTVLAQLKFDNSEDINQLKKTLKINTSGIQLINSNAPIFARAPELNINLLSASYELQWNGGDYKQAASYFLEKSTNNSPYNALFSIQADNSVEKNYSFLDLRDQNSDVVYYRVKQVNKDGSVVYSSQVKVGQGLLEPFLVEQNFPNPFNPKTSIVVELFQDSEIEVTVYNLEGQQISELYKGFLAEGIHKFSFDAQKLPSGIYLYRVSTPSFTKTRKMVLAK